MSPRRQDKESFDGGNPDKLSENQASTLVFDNYRRSRDNIVSPRSTLWRESYKKYRSSLDESLDSGLFNELFIPLTSSTIESFQPAIVKNRPRIEVWGREKSDEDRASAIRAKLMQDWESMGMAMNLVDLSKNGQIYGASWWKLSYRKEGRTRKVKVSEEVQSTVVIQGEEVPVPGRAPETQVKEIERFIFSYNGPHCQLCDIDTIYPDDKSSVDDCEYIIHETVQTLQQLEDALGDDGNPLYKNLDALREASDTMNQFEKPKDREKLINEMTERFGGASMINPDPHKREFTILERWSDDQVITVVKELEDDISPIRNEPNPYGIIPFVLYTPIPLPGELYGISMTEILWALNHELNVLHAARTDNLMLNTHRMFKVMRGGGVNPRHLRARPGGLVWVDDMGDVEPFETQPMEFAPYREADEIRMWAQLASGSTDTFQGLDTGLTGGTATEANLLAQASASRAGLMFQILTEQALKRFGKIMIRMYEVHVTNEEFIRVGGENFSDLRYERLSPEDFYTHGSVDWDVVIDVAATEPATREFRMNRAGQALSVLAELFPPDHPAIEHFSMMLLEGFGIDRPQILIEQGRQALEAQRQREAQAEAGIPPGGGSVAETLAVDAAAPFDGSSG
jgi:hypothetical protein